MNNMNKRNYQKELDRVIESSTRAGVTPRLLLHVCCAPCSSYCLEYLSDYFDITVYFYNPNITSRAEYAYRLSEEERYISLRSFKNPVLMTESEYDPQRFFEAVRGLEREPEGGKRCESCFRLRLEAAARKARELGFDCFTTTLTKKKKKNAALLNETTAAVYFQKIKRRRRASAVCRSCRDPLRKAENAALRLTFFHADGKIRHRYIVGIILF